MYKWCIWFHHFTFSKTEKQIFFINYIVLFSCWLNFVSLKIDGKKYLIKNITIKIFITIFDINKFLLYFKTKKCYIFKTKKCYQQNHQWTENYYFSECMFKISRQSVNCSQRYHIYRKNTVWKKMYLKFDLFF